MTDIKKDTDKAKLAYAMFTDVDKIEKNTAILNKPKEYRPSEEDIKIIIQQTNCSEEDAGKYLHKHKGDIEKTVFDILGLLDETEHTSSDFIKEEDLLNENISTVDKIETYRDILYHKDLIFQDKFDETSDLGQQTVINFDYIQFNTETKEYRKLKYKGNKENFTTDVIHPYFVLNKDKKVIIKTIVRNGLNMVKKWGCVKPVLAYVDVEDIDKIPNNMNSLATKFMVKSGHFDETQFVYGQAMVIDNWIM